MAGTPTFHLGLALAGAVSAGAYTAGVLDFLRQALDTWEQAKRDGQPVPRHRLALRAVAGSSAGGISAGLLAAELVQTFRPHTQPAAPPAKALNRSYDLWVKRARIEEMLTDHDLQSGEIRSLLNATVLDSLAADVFRSESAPRWPAYLDDSLEVLVTTSNLSGVPYTIKWRNAPAQRATNHEVVDHAGLCRFYLRQARDPDRDARGEIWLDPSDVTAPAWSSDLRTAMLATSAFPVGLAARRVRQPAAFYEQRRWEIPKAAVPEENVPREMDYGVLYNSERIPPATGYLPQPYEYVAVDGGMVNNEPFEYVRRILAGSRERNPRGGLEADAAVLMVDPFPNRFDRSRLQPGRDATLLTSVVASAISALVEQARFKLEDLTLADDEDVFSRFLIAPIRRVGGSDAYEVPPLASSPLGGFGGFLSEDLREHDFQLGRRNCQQFLKRHLAVPEGNPIFRTDSRHFEGIDFEDAAHPGSPMTWWRPIVPVIGAAATEVPAPAWPQMRGAAMEAILDRIFRRTEALVATAVAGGSWRTRAGAWIVWRALRGTVQEQIRSKLDEELRAARLLRG